MAQPIVTLMPSGDRRGFPAGTLLADALFDMGAAVRTPCGGRGTCGRCRVRVEEFTDEVLACRTAVDRDLTVHTGVQGTDRDVRIPGLGQNSRVAAAVDLGTTTVKMALADLDRGTSCEISAFLNPQRRFGHDVISRIAAARDPVVRASLEELIRRAVQTRLGKALAAAGSGPERLERIVLSGNTTMLYLFMGLDVDSLGRYPYTAATRDFTPPAPGPAGPPGFGDAGVLALPVLSAFIGADLIGALALCLADRETPGTFFIDLGTNGELFLLDGRGRIFATSCAMGPALEGMSISWGMTADDGAITHVRETPEGLSFDMIGTGEPAGITGTALIDLLAILLDRGVVSPTGSFPRDMDATDLPAPLVSFRDEGVQALGLWGRIRITQKDIRSVQLAKAATLAASHLLLENAGTGPGDIRRVYVAGALGGHVDMGRFKRLGFIPAFPNASIEYLGNTSLQAAVRACLDPDFPARAAALRDSTQELVLSAQETFQDRFMESIDFPGG